MIKIRQVPAKDRNDELETHRMVGKRQVLANEEIEWEQE